MTAEGALAYAHCATSYSSGSAGLGHALDMSGVSNLLGGIQSVCSMGSGPLSAVLGDLEQLRSRGAITSPSSKVTAVDIIAWPSDSASSSPPGLTFQHVCSGLPPTPNPTLTPHYP